jgi:hypothetical protein
MAIALGFRRHAERANRRINSSRHSSQSVRPIYSIRLVIRN